MREKRCKCKVDVRLIYGVHFHTGCGMIHYSSALYSVDGEDCQYCNRKIKFIKGGR